MAWELESLNEEGRKLHIEINTLCDNLGDTSFDMCRNNVPKKLCAIKERMECVVKGVSQHKRTPATHALVIMISPEERCRKPYALPVQCIPYQGLKDVAVRDLFNLVIKEMVQRGMKVAGETILYIDVL